MTRNKNDKEVEYLVAYGADVPTLIERLHGAGGHGSMRLRQLITKCEHQEVGLSVVSARLRSAIMRNEALVDPQDILYVAVCSLECDLIFEGILQLEFLDETEAIRPNH